MATKRPAGATKSAAHKIRKIPKIKIFFRVIHSKTQFPKIALRILVTKCAIPPVQIEPQP
jgi:hypothetical protein